MKVKAIQSLDGLAEIRSCWENWQNHVNSDFAQFNLLCRLRPDTKSPYVMVVGAGNAPRALVIARLEKTDIGPAVGYWQLPKMPVKVLTVIHHGVVGDLDDEGALDVVQHVQGMLKSGAADAVDFHYLAEGSVLLQALRRHAPSMFCEKTDRWSTHREMLVPAQSGFLETLRGKHRTNLRKREKELTQAFQGRIAWQWLTHVEDIPALCSKLEKVAETTYQRGLGAGFYNNEHFRSRFELFAGCGKLRVATLEIDGQYHAFWFGFVYGDTFHSSETGYDPALRDYEVGTLMFVRMVDELAREGVRRLDFGIGDAYYKERFGHRTWRETCVWWSAPTLKGTALMLYVRLFGILEQAGRRVVERFGLADRVKNAWRRHRAKGAVASGAAKART
jgi:hypothetical protein